MKSGEVLRTLHIARQTLCQYVVRKLQKSTVLSVDFLMENLCFP